MNDGGKIYHRPNHGELEDRISMRNVQRAKKKKTKNKAKQNINPERKIIIIITISNVQECGEKKKIERKKKGKKR